MKKKKKKMAHGECHPWLDSRIHWHFFKPIDEHFKFDMFREWPVSSFGWDQIPTPSQWPLPRRSMGERQPAATIRCMYESIVMFVLDQKGSQTRARVSVAFSYVGVKLPRIKRAPSGFRGQNGFRTRKWNITCFFYQNFLFNSKCLWSLLVWTWFL